jgi:predicted secreted hydrolase
MDDLKFGHFAITEVGRNAFRFHQEVARGAFGEAGFGVSGGDERRLAWLNDWSLIEEPDGSAWRLSAMQPTARISLRLVPAKRWVLHGAQGLSTKSAEAGNASYYYSGTRLRTEGSIEWLGADGLVARTERVAGESWFDHEWASSQLGPQQVGWDWFSLQLADGTELMLYQLRNKDGTVAPASSATWVEADGSSRHLTRSMYELTPVREWRSPHTGARYPVGWRIRIPSLAFEAEVRTPVENQELRVAPISYWEGVIDIEGKRAGLPIGGHGYLELTGYSGPVVGLQPVGTDGASSLGNNPGSSKKLQP